MTRDWENENAGTAGPIRPMLQPAPGATAIAAEVVHLRQQRGNQPRPKGRGFRPRDQMRDLLAQYGERIAKFSFVEGRWLLRSLINQTLKKDRAPDLYCDRRGRSLEILVECFEYQAHRAIASVVLSGLEIGELYQNNIILTVCERVSAWRVENGASADESADVCAELGHIAPTRWPKPGEHAS